MNKKTILLGLLILVAWSIPAAEEIQTIPYENFIAKEYNRIRAGADRYSSFNNIMHQSLRGKSIEQKHKIIADMKALKSAVHAAYLQAQKDGKALWHCFYIWKDNNPAIQALIQCEADVTHHVVNAEREMHTDIVKLIRYITPFTVGLFAGITLLWLTQGNLSYEYYKEHKHHGIIEMLIAPLIPIAHAGATGIQHVAKYIANAGSSTQQS